MRTDGMTETLVALCLGSQGAKILGKHAFCVCVCVCVCVYNGHVVAAKRSYINVFLHKRVHNARSLHNFRISDLNNLFSSAVGLGFSELVQQILLANWCYSKLAWDLGPGMVVLITGEVKSPSTFSKAGVPITGKVNSLSTVAVAACNT